MCVYLSRGEGNLDEITIFIVDVQQTSRKKVHYNDFAPN